MSNLHAKAKRWDKVVAVRKVTKERKIKKEYGLSCIEIRNDTQIFVSDDNRHVESVQIRAKVNKLLGEIKSLGYLPDTASGLQDVEDEQKEEYLSHHNEKLAISYGLMKTPPGTPIRVIKNPRMCYDCHSVAKYISKATQRMIIVGDVHRFHHFRDESCSCADYW